MMTPARDPAPMQVLPLLPQRGAQARPGPAVAAMDVVPM